MSYFVWYLDEQAVTFVNGELPKDENADIYDEPTDLLPGILSAEDTTWYSELESDTRELPPIPVVCDELGKYYYVDIDGGAKGLRSSVIYDEPEFDSGISSDVSPSSTVETPYYGLDTSTRELLPDPDAYDTMVKPVYINTNIATNEATSGIICGESEFDTGISSNVSPYSIVEAPYYGLETSTREPPPAPDAYDTMVKPVYINTNIAANEATSGMICDEPQSDSEISLNVIPSSEMESTVYIDSRCGEHIGIGWSKAFITIVVPETKLSEQIVSLI